MADLLTEFFSPEALRMLEECATSSGLAGQPSCFGSDIPNRSPYQEIEPNAENQNISTPICDPIKKRKPATSQESLPGLYTFSMRSTVKTKRQRTTFDLQRRKEVARVRQRGACLRCQSLKISVGELLRSIHEDRLLMLNQVFR